MARSPGCGVRAGLPAGLLGRADAGQRSLILPLQTTKGSTLWARPLSSQVHESSCNCSLMCVCERLCQLLSTDVCVYFECVCLCGRRFSSSKQTHFFCFFFKYHGWGILDLCEVAAIVLVQISLIFQLFPASKNKTATSNLFGKRFGVEKQFVLHLGRQRGKMVQ